MAEAPDAPSLGGKLGEIKETLTIDVKKSMENVKELLENLKKLQTPIKDFKKVSEEVTKTFAKIKKDFSGPDGTIALLKKFGKEFTAWVKQLELVKKITPAFEKLLGQFGKLKPHLDKLNPALKAAQGNFRGMHASINTLGGAEKTISKVPSATEKSAAAAKTDGGAWKLVGSVVAALSIGPMASFFNFLSNKLNPELGHITGSVKQQSDAMLEMRANVVTLASAFEKGNKQWGDVFQNALERIGALITGTVNPSLAESVGYWSGFASTITRATGAVLSVLNPLVQVGGAIGLIRAGLKTQFMQNFTKQALSTEKAVTSLSGALRVLGKIGIQGAREAIVDTKSALAGLWASMRTGGRVLKGLVTGFAPLRIALIALTTVAAIGSIFKVTEAWADNTKAIERNLTAMQKLRTVNKELAAGLDTQFKSLRRQAEGLKLQRLALAGDPIVQVYEAKIQGKEDLEQIQQQLKQVDELLKKHPDITQEIKEYIKDQSETWGRSSSSIRRKIMLSASCMRGSK